jgi:hypothetical protein
MGFDVPHSGDARQSRIARAQIGNLTAIRMANDSTSLHPSEYRRETVVIVLSPSVEWVIVAIRALHPCSHKDIGNKFRMRSGIVDQSSEIRRSDLMGIPFTTY